MKEGKQSNPSIQWLVFNLLYSLDLRMSASPALLRNCELSHPQEIQQTLNCRNKKSYWAFGKCSEQHCSSPAAKHCSTDAVLVEMTGRGILQNTCDCRTQCDGFSGWGSWTQEHTEKSTAMWWTCWRYWVLSSSKNGAYAERGNKHFIWNDEAKLHVQCFWVTARHE